MVKITPINRKTGELKAPMYKDIKQYALWLERAFNRGYEVFELDDKLLVRAMRENEKNNFWISEA